MKLKITIAKVRDGELTVEKKKTVRQIKGLID